MKRRSVAVAACAVIILAAFGWYWGSPWWTLYRMREAARAGDVEGLARYVDYDGIDARRKAAAPTFYALPP